MPANKINIRFVATLGAVLVVLFAGVAFVAYQRLSTSGAEYEARGDALMAQGMPREASGMYRRAVRHDRTNVVWLTKWREALLQTIPETGVEYNQYYTEFYRGSLGMLAALQERDPDAQRDYIGTIYDELRFSGAAPEAWVQFADIVSSAINRLPAEDPRTQSLHRYRALANLARGRTVDLNDDEVRKIREDLETALAGDPNDIEAAASMVIWHSEVWRRAVRARRTETAARAWQDTLAALESQKEKFPGEPMLALVEIQLTAQNILSNTQTLSERLAALSDVDQIDAPLIDALADRDPATLDPSLLDRAYATLQQMRAPSAAARRLLPILDAVAQSQTERPHLMILRADMLAAVGRHRDAIEQLDQLLALPDLPVSLEGLMLMQVYRAEALFRQGEAYLSLFNNTEDAAERQTLLASAHEARGLLVQRVSGGETAPNVMLLDARLALAEGRPRVAAERLAALDEQREGRDLRVIRLLGTALAQSNLLGAAREQFLRIIENNPLDIDALFRLGDIERSLRELKSAESRYEQILTVLPDSADARLRLSAIRAEQGVVTVLDRTAVDPVSAALIRWRTLMNFETPAVDDALKSLTDARAALGDDPRLINGLILHHAQAGNIDAARAQLDEAERLFPDDDRFGHWRARLSLADARSSLDDVLAAIDESESRPLERLLTKHDVCIANGAPDRASEFLREAASLAPADPRVLDRRFSRAIVDNDIDTARAVVAEAARANADSVGGALYQGRLEFSLNEIEKAHTTLSQVVDRIPFDSSAWRLLGQTRLRLGRVGEALEAFERAFTTKPDDANIARLYAQTLAQLQRGSEALEVARRARRLTPGNPELNDLWLALEESFGDAGLAALERGERFAAAPDDFANTLALARIHIGAERWDEARKVLDTARAARPKNPAAARLDAEWHARRGDIEAGAGVLRGIAEEQAPAGNHLAVAQYYLEHNLIPDARRELEAARSKQPAGEKNAEIMLADLHFAAGEYEQALPLFREALTAATGARAGDISRRMAEGLLRLERFEDATRALSGLDEAQRRDPRTFVLLARAAAGSDNARAAARLLDDGIQANPTSAMLFVERASQSMQRPEQLNDALADATQAIRLAPGMPEARRLRVAILARLGRMADAIAETEQALAVLSNDRELWRQRIELLIASGESLRAADAADKAAERFPAETIWLVTAGDLHAQSQRWNDAAPRYQKAYEIAPNVRLAVRLGQTLLEIDQPRPREVIALMDRYIDGDDLRSTTRLLKSAAHAEAGERDAALNAAIESLDEARTTADLRDWFRGIEPAFPEPSARLEFVRSRPAPEGLESLHTFLVSQLSLAAGAAHIPTLVAELTAAEAGTTDPTVLVDIVRLLGQIHYSSGDYNAAASFFEKGTKLNPEDVEFNNNLAYTLARHLNQPARALAPAEQAARLAPSSASILDTLGWVYALLDRLDEASATLNRALNNARTDDERAPAHIHLAETMLRRQDTLGAARHAESAQRILARSAVLRNEYGEALDRIMKQLESSE